MGEILDQLLGDLPLPGTLFEGTWMIIGWLLANTLGSKCDEGMMEWIDNNYPKDNGFWSKNKNIILKTVAKLLNFVHHSWMGLLGAIYFGGLITQTFTLPVVVPVSLNAELFWLSIGIAVEDLQYHARASLGDGFLSKVSTAIKKTHD